MTTGMTRPASALVTALNSLQKAMMLTPCWPSAGPTGGAGLACPAGICSLICPTAFFAINYRIKMGNGAGSALLHLPVFEFDGRVAPENVHRHLELAALRVDLLNHTAEVEEGTVVDLHGLADFKIDLGLLVFLGSGDLLLDLLDLVERSGVRSLATHKPDGPGRFLDEIIGLGQHPAVFVQQRH